MLIQVIGLLSNHHIQRASMMPYNVAKLDVTLMHLEVR